MVKILYIITQSEMGGAQRYVFDLATNLNKSQYDIYIAHGGSDKGIFDSIEAENLTIHSIKHLIRSISPINDIKAYFELKNLIKSIHPDIVHLNSSKVGILGSMTAKACKVPKIIYTAHGFVFNEPLYPVVKWIYKQAELFNAKRVDRIIAVSEYDKQTGIKAGISDSKLIAIHNGINPNIDFLTKKDALVSLREGSSTLQATKQSHGYRNEHGIAASVVSTLLPRNDKIIGCIANFYRTKGLDILIDAMAKVDAHLFIIGDGQLRENLEAQIQKHDLQDKITLPGQIPNASQYLKAFDLFVLPSRKEGLSYTLLEAQAAQIRIVATKVGGTPEIIQDNVNGYLAESNNADDLANKINLAIKKPLASNLANDFTLEKMLEKTQAMYQS